jgi:hypothetical protein
VNISTVPILQYCTFSNNIARNKGFGNDVCYYGNASTSPYSSNTNKTGSCSSSSSPHISGNVTTIITSFTTCSSPNYYYENQNCIIFHRNCESYSNEDSEEENNSCDEANEFDTTDGPCIWYSSISNDSNNKKCGSKKYFKCNFYEDIESCNSDEIINEEGGCEWFPLRIEGYKCDNTLFHKFYVMKEGIDFGTCLKEAECKTIDYVMINHINISQRESVTFIDSGIYDYSHSCSNTEYYNNISFTLTGMISSSSSSSSYSSSVSIDDINTYPVINSINSNSIYMYVFYLHSNFT